MFHSSRQPVILGRSWLPFLLFWVISPPFSWLFPPATMHWPVNYQNAFIKIFHARINMLKFNDYLCPADIMSYNIRSVVAICNTNFTNMTHKIRYKTQNARKNLDGAYVSHPYHNLYDFFHHRFHRANLLLTNSVLPDTFAGHQRVEATTSPSLVIDRGLSRLYPYRSGRMQPVLQICCQSV